ncbi:Hemin transport system permease protein HmuU [Corynebacterium cystitidis DSM 20524]|uniref:Iron complex transport system permease protein n=3 Tax=Corynebacterium cystitidis TaxID=35757 RepID=A0A1H9U9F1_9CORY|nr:Hemin transport system permease protein HmuU [Corynebacterium cystitidis DSM 20524]SES05754.1 iron complex transport system permease protein [Corynebacterium cystitidis DSM 20524]SNV89117.1 iron ABC transporter permease [Corynebacterium cystitidis]
MKSLQPVFATYSPNVELGRETSPPRPSLQYTGMVRRRWIVILATFVLLLFLILAALMTGSSDLGLVDVLRAVTGGGDEYSEIVVWRMRMPRILMAVLGGIGLALAGSAFQAVLRNPLASASTLGISQGAAFGAAVSIIVVGGLTGASLHEGVASGNPYVTVACAFVGAMASTLVILGLSRLRDMTSESIVLAGVAISALFAGATAMIQYFAEDTQVAAVVFWTFGDLGRVNYQELAIVTLVVTATSIYFWRNRWNYNAMELGEGSAHGLGVNTGRTRLLSMLVGAAASSVVIAFCGTINFVGLIAAHIMRRLIGGDYRHLLLASALTGSCVLLASDLLARIIIPPVILPISSITSFIGAPLFLYLLMRRSKR